MLCGSLDGRGVWGRMGTCIHRLSPFAIHLNYHNIVGYTSIQNVFSAKDCAFTPGGCRLDPWSRDKDPTRHKGKVKNKWINWARILKHLKSPNKNKNSCSLSSRCSWPALPCPSFPFLPQQNICHFIASSRTYVFIVFTGPISTRIARI